MVAVNTSIFCINFLVIVYIADLFLITIERLLEVIVMLFKGNIEYLSTWLLWLGYKYGCYTCCANNVIDLKWQK